MVTRNVATAVLGRLREGRLEIAEPGGRRHAFGPANSRQGTGTPTPARGPARRKLNPC
jgi:hypothetical protein